MEIKKRKTRNYINNKDLYTAMVQHRTRVLEARAKGVQEPQIPNYIGEAIILINDNLIKKPNFSGYSPQWKQEMLSDGKLDCIAAVKNFNPDRTDNPFGYFTQIAWHAFIRRITKEKKQTYIKHKNFENSFLTMDIAGEVVNFQLKSNDLSSDIIRSFEDKLQKKGKAAKMPVKEETVEE